MTRQPFLFLLAFMLLLCVSPLHAGALGLSEACQRALEYDARYRAAEAEHAVQKEETARARSRFRPSLRMNAASGRSTTESTSLVNDLSKEQSYNTRNYSIQLRQSVFNLSDFESYGQAKAVVAKSDAVLESELSSLLVRTLEAYINVLYARDNLEFSRAHVQTAKEQLAQAKRRLAAGFGTITEVSEAQAGYDMALAEGLEFNNTLEVNRRALESMTGVYPDSLQEFVPEKMVLAVPAPHDVGQWIRLAHENNPLREAAAQDVSYFRKQIDKSRAARYPVVELVASKTFSESDNNYSIGTRYDTYAISMQMSIPLYSGGFVSSSVRQASGQLRGAYEQLSLRERNLALDVRKYYTGIISSIAQIRAYEQAVKANEIALTGTRKGFGAGFRSNVDVLSALKNLYDSKRNLSKSRYLFVLNVIRLKEAAGVLTTEDVAAIAGWTR
ncbi:MAG: TolC family outer membrane protein [Chlorobiaceae bacterium]|nr:TolC family outer membrane protein [Chlorobiaceae bacterium]